MPNSADVHRWYSRPVLFVADVNRSLQFHVGQLGELADRSVPHRQNWWGYDATRIDDPDGNELLFPVPD